MRLDADQFWHSINHNESKYKIHDVFRCLAEIEAKFFAMEVYITGDRLCLSSEEILIGSKFKN